MVLDPLAVSPCSVASGCTLCARLASAKLLQVLKAAVSGSVPINSLRLAQQTEAGRAPADPAGDATQTPSRDRSG